MTFTGDPPPRDLSDRVLRQSLQSPANLRAFLGVAVPQLADRFDCDRARLLQPQFPMDSWREREADLPFEVPFRQTDGDIWALVFVLIEHQSDTDPVMPLRMLITLALYWERQWREWVQRPRPKPALRLSPVLPIVLYTGPNAWGSNTTVRDLLGGPPELHAFAPAWGPLFWNLADQTAEQLLASGDQWLQTLAVLREQGADREEFEAVFRRAVEGVQALPESQQMRWDELMRVLLTWAMWRRPPEERNQLLTFTEATSGPLARRQEVRTMSTTIAESLMTEGSIKTAREMLTILLEDRFGPLPDDLRQRLESVQELQRLQTAFQQALRLERLEELQL